MLKVIDIFCGCGGLSCGFLQEGFKVVAGFDISKAALKTFKYNFPEAYAVSTDLSITSPFEIRVELGLEKGELDCLIGGPPCQGFSKNVPAAQRFLDDPRNRLMQAYLAFVEEFQPRTLLIENVAEIVKAYDQAVTRQITQELRRLDFNVTVHLVNAADYGVPQLRRRAFFLASREKAIKFPQPSYTKKSATDSENQTLGLIEEKKAYVTSWEAINDLPTIQSGGGQNPMPYQFLPQNDYQKTIRDGNRVVYDHVARNLTAIQLERVEYLREGQNIKNLPDNLRPSKGYSGAYGRLYPNEPARTITRWVFHPGSGRFYHPYDNRIITIREAARLQSFPDWFVFTGTYIEKSHQVGEAVPPLLVRQLAKAIRKTLIE